MASVKIFTTSVRVNNGSEREDFLGKWHQELKVLFYFFVLFFKMKEREGWNKRRRAYMCILCAAR